MSIDTNYRIGQRKFNDWLINRGIELVKVEDLGYQRDEDGWDHSAYTMTITSEKMPMKELANGTHSHTRQESYDFPYRMGMAHTRKPKLYDLMASLFSDASCVMNSRGFEDFATELGYDPDSRKAEQTYEQIKANNAKLLKLFGTTDLENLYREAEPLLEEAGLR